MVSRTLSYYQLFYRYTMRHALPHVTVMMIRLRSYSHGSEYRPAKPVVLFQFGFSRVTAVIRLALVQRSSKRQGRFIRN